MVKRRPTAQQLLALLNRSRLVVQERHIADGESIRGEWVGHGDGGDGIVGTIYIGLEKHRTDGKARGIVNTIAHELCHAFFEIKCRDDRIRHDRIRHWEMELADSRALRGAILGRVVNSYAFREEYP